MKPWLLPLALLAGSLGLSAVLWVLGFPFFFLFLFVPLVPLLGRKPSLRRCPACGWETAGDEKFCPFDATPLAGTGGERVDGKDR